MKSKNEGLRRAVAHLTRTCSSNGHGVELFNALQLANPELAAKHWETVPNMECAGLVLGLSVATNKRESTNTVLDGYLFGDPDKTLEQTRSFCKVLLDACVSRDPSESAKSFANRMPRLGQVKQRSKP